jgi:hypothetical protein
VTVGGLRCDGECGTHIPSSKPYPKGWIRMQLRGRRTEPRDDTEMRPLRTADVCSPKCGAKVLVNVFPEVTEPAEPELTEQAGVSAQP